METRAVKIKSKANSMVAIKVIQGHFATNHSHINYYIDMTTLKARQSEAAAAAELLARKYEMTTFVDTIVCMDGCEVIGSYLAQQLSQAGIMSMNQHKTIYIVTPELHTGGQLIFRDNMQMMIRGKHVVLLLSSITTGKSISRSLECIRYYGGQIAGISAVFSAYHPDEVEINSIFTEKDIPDYKTYDFSDCPMCANKVPVDAIVNSYGYSKI
ncbi:orotate phosphoribosyltransferase [uncultured Robinsoniella sp.]|uniref:orotate phosphoribosyltransferase n=1 Tax=uncultured Robinsoniella sp. TaxID=904190 RepID=UPI00374F61DD